MKASMSTSFIAPLTRSTTDNFQKRCSVNGHNVMNQRSNLITSTPHHGKAIPSFDVSDIISPIEVETSPGPLYGAAESDSQTSLKVQRRNGFSTGDDFDRLVSSKPRKSTSKLQVRCLPLKSSDKQVDTTRHYAGGKFRFPTLVDVVDSGTLPGKVNESWVTTESSTLSPCTLDDCVETQNIMSRPSQKVLKPSLSPVVILDRNVIKQYPGIFIKSKSPNNYNHNFRTDLISHIQEAENHQNPLHESGRSKICSRANSNCGDGGGLFESLITQPGYDVAREKLPHNDSPPGHDSCGENQVSNHSVKAQGNIDNKDKENQQSKQSCSVVEKTCSVGYTSSNKSEENVFEAPTVGETAKQPDKNLGQITPSSVLEKQQKQLLDIENTHPLNGQNEMDGDSSNLKARTLNAASGTDSESEEYDSDHDTLVCRDPNDIPQEQDEGYGMSSVESNHDGYISFEVDSSSDDEKLSSKQKKKIFRWTSLDSSHSGTSSSSYKNKNKQYQKQERRHVLSTRSDESAADNPLDSCGPKSNVSAVTNSKKGLEVKSPELYRKSSNRSPSETSRGFSRKSFSENEQYLKQKRRNMICSSSDESAVDDPLDACGPKSNSIKGQEVKSPELYGKSSNRSPSETSRGFSRKSFSENEQYLKQKRRNMICSSSDESAVDDPLDACGPKSNSIKGQEVKSPELCRKSPCHSFNELSSESSNSSQEHIQIEATRDTLNLYQHTRDNSLLRTKRNCLLHQKQAKTNINRKKIQNNLKNVEVKNSLSIISVSSPDAATKKKRSVSATLANTKGSKSPRNVKKNPQKMKSRKSSQSGSEDIPGVSTVNDMSQGLEDLFHDGSKETLKTVPKKQVFKVDQNRKPKACNKANKDKENVNVVGKPVDGENTNPEVLRRSGRNRVQPTLFWLGERVEYHNESNGLRELACVSGPAPTARLLLDLQRKPKRALKSGNDKVKITVQSKSSAPCIKRKNIAKNVESPENSDQYVKRAKVNKIQGERGPMFNPLRVSHHNQPHVTAMQNSGVEVKETLYECEALVCHPEDIVMKNINSKTSNPNSAVQKALCVFSSNIKGELLEFETESSSGWVTADNCTKLFYVAEGCISFHSSSKTIQLSAGAMFIVNEGESYNIVNICASKSRLAVTSCKA